MRTLSLISLLAVGAACSSSSAPPANVAGNWTLAVTDQANACNLPNFTTGATSAGVRVQITQNGSSVSATVMGLSGLALSFAVGSGTLSGSISGSQATLTATANHAQGNCAYTTTATANITFNGTQLQGSISYSDAGNGSTDCGALQQCTSTQTFTGSKS